MKTIQITPRLTQILHKIVILLKIRTIQGAFTATETDSILHPEMLKVLHQKIEKFWYCVVKASQSRSIMTVFVRNLETTSSTNSKVENMLLNSRKIHQLI